MLTWNALERELIHSGMLVVGRSVLLMSVVMQTSQACIVTTKIKHMKIVCTMMGPQACTNSYAPQKLTQTLLLKPDYFLYRKPLELYKNLHVPS